MTQPIFGSGSLYGVRTDIATQTPVQFGVLKGIDIDNSFDLKPLVGQYQAPIAIGRGALKLTGKASFASINANLFNSLFVGQTLTASSGIGQVVNETGTVPGVSTYIITVTNSATFVNDEGVYYASTGLPLKRVASGPTIGQYSVSAGVYTFAAADASVAMLLNYTYTLSSGANKIVIANQLMGTGPTFRVNLATTFNSKILNLELNACVSGKLGFGFKNEDWMMQDFEFQALADSAGNIGTITTTE